MKYLNLEDLEKGKYYHCQSYNEEQAILKYYGDIPHVEWGMGVSWGDIRYVFREVENLEEAAKQFL